MKDEHQDFYQGLRGKIHDWLESKEGQDHTWADFLLLAPDLFHLLCKLSADPDVSSNDKTKLVTVIAYFISPIDLIPEAFLGPIGYVDDIALTAYILNRLLNRTDPEVIRRHWAGEEDVLKVIQKIIGVADQMVGSGIWNKLRGLVGGPK